MTGQKFEYRVVPVDEGTHLELRITRYAKKGWRLHTCFNFDDFNFLCIFERVNPGWAKMTRKEEMAAREKLEAE